MDAADGPTPLTALAYRRATVDDHARVVAVIPDWWGVPGTESLWRLLPRLFFQHFADTSTIVEDADGGLAGFLIGFRSPSAPDAAYIHFVGVRPDLVRLRRPGRAPRGVHPRDLIHSRATLAPMRGSEQNRAEERRRSGGHHARHAQPVPELQGQRPRGARVLSLRVRR